MNDVDSERLGLFLGILIVFAVIYSIVVRITDIHFLALAPVYMFSPLVASVVVVSISDVSISEVGLRVGRPAWLALSALVSLPLVGLALLIAVSVPGIGFDPTVDPIPGLDLPPEVLGVATIFGLILVLGATVNAVVALGEEFGWRGYLLWELAPLGFWRATAAIGVVWGLWHAPVIAEGYNFPSFPSLGIAVMVVATLAFSPVYTYLVVKAESVLAAAVLHGVFNGSGGLVIAYAVADGPVLEELVASPVGLAGIIAFGLAGVAIAIAGPPELTREFAAEHSSPDPEE